MSLRPRASAPDVLLSSGAAGGLTAGGLRQEGQEAAKKKAGVDTVPPKAVDENAASCLVLLCPGWKTSSFGVTLAKAPVLAERFGPCPVLRIREVRGPLTRDVSHGQTSLLEVPCSTDVVGPPKIPQKHL